MEAGEKNDRKVSFEGPEFERFRDLQEFLNTHYEAINSIYVSIQRRAGVPAPQSFPKVIKFSHEVVPEGKRSFGYIYRSDPTTLYLGDDALYPYEDRPSIRDSLFYGEDGPEKRLFHLIQIILHEGAHTMQQGFLAPEVLGVSEALTEILATIITKEVRRRHSREWFKNENRSHSLHPIGYMGEIGRLQEWVGLIARNLELPKDVVYQAMIREYFEGAHQFNDIVIMLQKVSVDTSSIKDRTRAISLLDSLAVPADIRYGDFPNWGDIDKALRLDTL